MSLLVFFHIDSARSIAMNSRMLRPVGSSGAASIFPVSGTHAIPSPRSRAWTRRTSAGWFGWPAPTAALSRDPGASCSNEVSSGVQPAPAPASRSNANGLSGSAT